MIPLAGERPSVGQRGDEGSMETDHVVRRITPEDLPEILALERRCYTYPWSEEMFRRELDNPLSTVELLRMDNRLAGYLCSWQVADEMHILNVATDPEFRRRGVARELLQRCFDRAKKNEVAQVLLEVREGNAGAIALYRTFGFRVSGHRPRYYPDGEDALLMKWSKGGEGDPFSPKEKMTERKTTGP